MTTQGGTTGSVLGLRDDLSSLAQHLSPSQYPFALLDILLVAIVLYYTYLLIRETRAIRILYGLVFLGVVYVVAQWLQLLALLFLIQSIFAVVLVAIPVVFQPELRAGLEKLGRTRFMGSLPNVTRDDQVESARIVANAAVALAAKKVGALIVFERRDRLVEPTASGIAIHGYASPELLITIFTNKSPLHDGAVIIRGMRLETASALLPVAGDRFDSSVGTRHRAAIGVTRETDAVAVVVSEESGRIGVAADGKLTRNIKPEDLEGKLVQVLTSFSADIKPVRRHAA